MTAPQNISFSTRLAAWLSSSKPKTIQGLTDNFADKSFAILCLVLMSVPALPIPTGGITHVFELIVFLLALEMMWGRSTIWLPKRWREVVLPAKIQTSTLPKLHNLIQKIEKYSRPRLASLLNNKHSSRILGVLIFILTAFAFVSPPFSGLDTLPAIGVVLISLGMILNDYVPICVGLLAGGAGVVLILTLGGAVLRLI